MQKTLIDQSIALIASGQAASGAYVACPLYPTYKYCWFRDGTFIAYAMDLWEMHAGTRRFYDWTTQAVNMRADAIGRCVESATQGRALNPVDLLHARYTLDGQPGSEKWGNFQLDGLGTLLWGIQRHVQLTNIETIPASWAKAVGLLVRYLAALWQHPNFDCWEEFGDQIAISTLATLYAGLRAISVVDGVDKLDVALATETATHIKVFVLAHGVRDGHLIKQVRGEDIVDASLLWACLPFQEHGLFHPSEPVMQVTAARIKQDLTGATGGIHRYRADTFYGGGEWILLTALFGEYQAVCGNIADACRCQAYIEASADERGHLPEQNSHAPLFPEHVREWQECWGSVARPLLWSHAAYLSLSARLRQ